MMTNLISLADLNRDEVLAILDLAVDLKAQQKAGREHRLLKGQSLAMIFEKPSLRTRVTFETGMFQLGGHSLFLEFNVGERESVPDLARNLERWVDGIVARTHNHAAVVEMAEYASVPVINALTDALHPCQVLADALTLQEHKGTLDGLRVAFVGDGNNMFASWVNLAAHFEIDLTLVCPEGYALSGELDDNAKGEYRVCHELREGVDGADVVYTDVWTSMGQEAERETRLKTFMPYQVNAEVMGMAKPDAVFMHCLPAHRGEEVSNEVIEGKQSVVFDEAENRLHVHKAVMVTLMKK